MNHTSTYLCIIASLTLGCFIVTDTACSKKEYHNSLILAEEQVTKSADSCAHLLNSIPVDELNQEDQALYNLIYSWMLYRQYTKNIPEEPLNMAFDYYHESSDPHRRAQVYFLRSVINQDQSAILG